MFKFQDGLTAQVRAYCAFDGDNQIYRSFHETLALKVCENLTRARGAEIYQEDLEAYFKNVESRAMSSSFDLGYRQYFMKYKTISSASFWDELKLAFPIAEELAHPQ
ncbi:hypothetical protein [Variovorax sp. E3]|uniref:hypothetical protein n=1 Tax=Variovorax sp. E3 TaxID=1914993 RepID=UPI0018DE84E3|nr:hypothetical protein [Variovorax sp. E3]